MKTRGRYAMAAFAMTGLTAARPAAHRDPAVIELADPCHNF
jgi:hypothetical protein